MNEHEWTCCFLRASTTAPLKEPSAKQAGIEFCFMTKKGGICVLNPFQAGDSGAEVRVEAAHYSQNSRLPACSLFSMKNVLRWWEVLGKAVCRPVVKVTQQACKNGGTTSLWFGVAACLGHLLRRHQKDLLQQRKYRSRCGSSWFCSRAKQFSPCLCRKASDVHVELGDVPEPKSCFNMFQGEYTILYH